MRYEIVLKGRGGDTQMGLRVIHEYGGRVQRAVCRNGFLRGIVDIDWLGTPNQVEDLQTRIMDRDDKIEGVGIYPMSIVL